uniref:Nuclear pore complex protein Nup214 phenylalanine-glycine (FG) domain-containing protein n=1 Tax=Stomoxys calcitrans TaxID=35570 RepID=A0A1I8NM08_STOCA
MAQNAPSSVDVQDIQFKLHGKFPLFPETKESKSLVSLLAVSSTKGLLFAGNPNARELKVVKIKDAVDAKSPKDLPVRVVPLPGEPKAVACSCDGSMLAVNYMLNNTGFLQIYPVDCFVTTSINASYNVPISPESYVFALQLLWNPVIANNIALILSDGSVTMFTLNSGGQYDKVTLGKENQVKSGCWSPKGKQIVLGFAEGKLQQFKPNLQPARAIPCPPGVHPGPFDCIAVHWLSTFQFAVIFLQRGEDMCPSLFIVNAPKAGGPSYINYYDVCYSASGPRTQQLTFNHIAPWNLLLVSSANGVEVGVLGTKESGENPTWIQYTLLDEARVEMPLTESKDETFPMGFVYDTSSAHQVKMGEKALPVMPMIHVLSTHGHLVSFNFLNLSPNCVDVCSPPPPLNDMSGQFRPLHESMAAGVEVENRQKPPENAAGGSATAIGMGAGGGMGDMTFTLGSSMVTSTPAIKDKPVPMFGGLASGTAKPGNMGFGFGAAPAAPPPTSAASIANKPGIGFGLGGSSLTAQSTAPTGFGAQTTATAFGAQTTATAFGGFGTNQNFGVKETEKATAATTTAAPKNTDANKPLYTVPPTFKPPAVVQPTKSTANAPQLNMNAGEIDELVKQMIAIQIEAFETEIRHIQQQSKKLIDNIGSPEEIKSYTKHLNDLQEIIEQADDHEFEQDVQSLRHSMNESYAMLAECRTKLDMFNNPNLSRLTTACTTDPTSRRQLAKLQAYLATNHTQLNQVNQLIDAQWTQYQDIVRRNTKNQMHIPCLDGIYQRMSKLKDMLSRQRTKMNHIKSKLKQKGLNYKPADDTDAVTTMAVGALTKNQNTMESLADSILSMSLSQVVSQTHAKLSENKMNAIRNFTRQQQQITIIKPKRPERIGLKSEVILETKLKTVRKQKEMVKEKQVQKQQQHHQQSQFSISKPSMPSQQLPNIQTAAPQPQQTFLAKPTASKPPMLPTTSQPASFITPTTGAPSALSFGNQQSSFVKTSTSTSSAKLDDSTKFMAPSSASFAAFGGSSNLTFGQSKPNTSNVEGKENQPTQATMPISFSAKVIGGNDAKAPLANLGNKTFNVANNTNEASTTNQGFAALGAIGTTAEKDIKKKEEASKTFSFGGVAAAAAAETAASSEPAATTTTTSFGGFGTLGKTSSAIGGASPVVSSSSGGGIFSSSLFGSTTPFASLATSSAAPFGNASTTFSFNSASTAAAAATTTTTKTANTTPLVTTKAQNEATATTAAEATKSNETKTSAEGQIKGLSTAGTTTTGSFSFGGMSISGATSKPIASTTTTTPSSTAPPNVTITSSGTPSAATMTAPKPSTTTSSATTTDTADSLFGTLNICKPNAKETSEANKTPGNIFSGFGTTTSTAPATTPFPFITGGKAGGDETTPFSVSATTAATPAFGSTTTANVFGKPSSTTETISSTTTATAAAAPATTTTAMTATAGTTSATTTTTSAFSFGSVATPTTATNASTIFGSMSSAPTATTASGNVFSGAGTATSIFAQAAAATSTSATSTSTTTNIFGGAAAAASSGPSLFGSTAPAMAAAAGTPNTGSIFGSNTTASPAAPTGGSIFGGIPKPDQSVFGSVAGAASPPATGLFAAAAAATKPPAANIFGGGAATNTGFGTAASGGSIFGGGGGAAAAPTSPFGAPANANTAGSIFGGAAATKPAEGGNIFGSPTQQSPSSGGSIFGKSSFGQTAASPQSAGSIFGGGTTNQSSTSPFGAPAGGSIFGGATTNNSSSGGSIFGGASTAPAFGSTTASSGFGSFSQPSNAPAFGSPSGGFGAAPAANAFGSPQQQSAFAKPVFGGPPTFGSPPAFGAQPTFGGAPTFGSPKGFGSFAATSPAGSVGFGGVANPAAAQAPKGNIFETLGSTDTGLSFGNLAQSTQPPNQQKPAFGGSSFMSYR